MHKRILVAAMIGAAFLAATTTTQAGDSNRIGVGMHYWTVYDNTDLHMADADGISWLASYQYNFGWIGLEADLEWFMQGYAGTDNGVLQPAAFVLVGKGLYAGAGIGAYFSDGTSFEKPCFILRAGLDFEVLPRLRLDLNVNYRFEDWDGLGQDPNQVTQNTISMGATVRYAF